MLAFSLVTCSKDRTIIRPFPSVQTLEVSNISESGATFNAKIINEGNLEIIEHGFVWNRLENPTIDNADKRVLTSSIVNNEFSAEITTTISKHKNFFIRAYVKTKDYLVYGKNVSFISLGSSPAIFDSFSPKIGSWGDTIKIKGKYFSFKKEWNRVSFKDLPSKVISNTDSTITCTVPRNVRDKTVPIYILVGGESVKSKEDFKFFLPEITSISPISATFGEEITITGKNFSNQMVDIQVFFGNSYRPQEAAIISSTQNTIKVIVPNNLESSSEPIKVISNLQEVTYPINFTLKPPTITFATPDINANKSINIIVNNFHPTPSKNKFTIENIPTQILSGEEGNYTVKVPWGPYPRRKAKIKVQVLDLITEYQFDVNILDKWVMVSNNLPFNYNNFLNNAVVAQGDAYIVATSKEDNNIFLWKFNQSDFSWEKKNLPFFSSSFGSNPIAESNGNKIYVYFANDNNDFWEYNPTSDQWSKKSSFIGNKRGGATHFSIGGNIYVGLGIDYEPYIPISYADFYKYNPTSDLWTRVSDIPFNNFGVSERAITASFVINGLGYFTGGGSTTGDLDAWSYNPTSDSWNRIADDTHSVFSRNPGFSLNGFGFITGTGASGLESWRYDPMNNIWEQSYNIGKPRGANFVFSLNGKVYIGGGGFPTGSFVSYELFEFVP